MKKPKYVYPSRISQSLFCTICSDVFLKPKRLPCGHVLCEECLADWMRKGNKKCPFDRLPIDTRKVKNETLANDILDDLEVYCAFKSSGCRFVDARKNIEIHESQCNKKNLPAFLRGKQSENVGCGDELLNEKLESQNTGMGLLMKIYEKNQNIVESELSRSIDVAKGRKEAEGGRRRARNADQVRK